ncbi:aspartyl-phosphate phosphatase Spo0E family protein [Bacillus shivajii]|uniref:aspartyl-phosphate phosphatase Spo0E family protein n=1 Tax=Bacillus shivajii TaxID=1983719 RepID=UPI001CFA99F4|nr:aspartyl-phosphate phosphatase Spo0E family protein [Bacillus shivajii]UCZ55251.1 aspartyl-phosphate phosphatase Spo0E family protein [Bacillus shivajii]
MGTQALLKKQMETKRSMMIEAATKKGFTSDETVQYSQELDQLMNLYRRLTEKSYRSNTYEDDMLSYMN